MVGIASRAMAVMSGILARRTPENAVAPPQSGRKRGGKYRAARRNQVLRGDVHGVWRGAKAQVIGYSPKSYRIGSNGWPVAAKTYKPNGAREQERRRRQRETREARSA